MSIIKRLCILCVVVLLLCRLSLHGQNIPDNAYGKYLPYTYEVPMGYMGKMITTVHEDGSMTSRMVTICGVCSGRGACNVCRGTGGQYWYGQGIRPCLSCGGSGRCGGCSGDGVAVINTHTTPNGVTVGYDEQGRAYIAYPGQSRGNGSPSSSGSKECKNCSVIGNGKCNTCNGRGTVTVMGVGSGTRQCVNCNGTGRCHWCGGTGKIR